MPKVRSSVRPVPIGCSFSNQYTLWNWDLDRLIYSTSNHRTKKGRWSGGGGFLVHHQRSAATPATLPSYTYLGNKHGGLAVPVGSAITQPVLPASPTYTTELVTLTPYGSVGWKRARPGNPVANAGQFIAELRQLPKIPLLDGPRDRILMGGLKGLPGRLLNRLASFRRLGSEYLNIQFGWAPFVRDLQEMHQLTLDIDRRLDRLRRDNGQSLHRRRTIKSTLMTNVTVSVTNGPFAYLVPTPIVIGGGRSVRTVQTEESERIWFVGRFRYFVPNIGTLEWRKRAIRALYGGNLTPSLAWEILPWSWLLDWFSNIGDVLSNMSQNAVDNTVADYAYVMRELSSKTTTTVQTSWGGRSGSPATYPAGSAIATLVEERVTKSRMAATPYGFGLTLDGISGYQASILAALGVSQGRFRI